MAASVVWSFLSPFNNDRLKNSKGWHVIILIYYILTVNTDMSASINSNKKTNPANIYLFKVNNRKNTRKCKICSKLTIKTSERCYWRCSGVFIVNFEHILDLILVFIILLTLKKQMLAGKGGLKGLKSLQQNSIDQFFWAKSLKIK